MAPIMALNPVIRANAKTEPDQTCFCVVVGEKSENQSVSRIVTIAHLTREREREKRKNTRHEVLMLTMKKDKSLLRVKNTAQQKPFPARFHHHERENSNFKLESTNTSSSRLSYLTVKRL